MSQVTLRPGDNRESLRRLIDEGVRVHSVVTDPPYGLVSIQKRFGKSGAAVAKSDKNDGSFARLSGGFMGKAWDGTGIERDPEFWALIWEILLPGGYCFAFGGARTIHWQTVAMEQAGFVIHPMHIWAFGSGFPKAHAADKAIDKYLGRQGSYSGVKPGHENFKGRGESSVQSLKGTLGGEGGFSRPWMNDAEAVDRYHSKYVPATPEASQWSGFAYGAQSQKPALEPITLAQKPFETKTGAENLLKHGVGAVNVDGCRTDAGRHPANLIHDGSESVVALFPKNKDGVAVQRNRDGQVHNEVYGAYKKPPGNDVGYGGEGSAARFFNSFPLTQEDIPSNVPPVFYNTKAGKADRAGSKHPTVKPVALMQHLVRHITPPGGVVLDPFAGTGTTAEAARREGFDCILMEAEPEYIDFLKERFPGCASAGECSIEELLGDPAPEITIAELLG